MALEEVRVAIGDLRPGMFVCRLDVPWSETRFPLQGVLVETAEDVLALRQHGSHVWVDRERSVFDGPRHVLLTLGRRGWSGAPPEAVDYALQATVAEEMPRLRGAIAEADRLLRGLLDDLHRGKPLAVEEVTATVEPVVASVIRNPDTFSWLSSLRHRAPYVYGHAINVAGLAVIVGRHLGLPPGELNDLATAGLLMDLGMARLPDGLCNHPLTLSAGDRRAMQGHVALTLEQVSGHGLPVQVLEAITQHHERHDGSGYPHGLKGFAISLNARILGLVDTFDAMGSDRPHQHSQARHNVLQALYRERDRLFQSELVEQFSQAIGVYPTGSLVELDNGVVAVVTAQNSARRLHPRVTALTKPDKSLDPAFPVLDLLLPDPATGRRLAIHRSLPPGAYGIDLAQLFL